ncbi:MAG: hypothetical protein JRH18_16335 [Deltaproteobacteria bacterium]|nr:hypothetical protein [Deltaproteobacteria bacterium]MBW2153226.1 hypothetical protein [Deltaproteobacteria bacterium]
MRALRTYFTRIEPDEKSGTGSKTSVSKKKKIEDEKFIRCSQCLQPITRPSERITVNGSHAHTFANPSGILYEIGCFRSVMGCGYMGPATDEFTWFKGYRWKIAYCGRCLTHLGWLFLSSSESFSGLILERLTDPE